MRGAVRPFVPGPWVIVTNEDRRVVGLGVERGRLTEAERRQFLPPPMAPAVQREQQEAIGRVIRAAGDRFGKRTPQKGQRRNRPRARSGYTIQRLLQGR